MDDALTIRLADTESITSYFPIVSKDKRYVKLNEFYQNENQNENVILRVSLITNSNSNTKASTNSNSNSIIVTVMVMVSIMAHTDTHTTEHIDIVLFNFSTAQLV